MARFLRTTDIEPMTRHREEHGQAMVEFTLIATVLATLMLAVFQFGVAFSDYISVADAARAAARKASTYGASSTYVAATETTSRAQAISSSEGSSGHTCVADNWCTTVTASPTWVAGNPVAATVTAPYSIKIFGFNIASGTLKHTVTMRIESKG
jgi:Flp pilus assembly protein TadG